MKHMGKHASWNVSEEEIVKTTKCSPLMAKLFKQTQTREQMFPVLYALMRLPMERVRFEPSLRCTIGKSGIGKSGIGNANLLWTYMGEQLTMNSLQALSGYQLVRAA